MNYKKFLVIAALAVFMGNAVFAQEALYFRVINTRPLAPITYTDVTGSPYLFEKFVDGEATLADGKHYKGLELQYDLVGSVLSFKYPDSKGAMTFSDNVVDFTLYPAGKYNPQVLYFVSSDQLGGMQTKESFCQVLEQGEATLFKTIKKVIKEVKAYASATVSKSFEQSSSYYIRTNKSVVKIRNKKDFIGLFPGKSELLEQFAKKQKLANDDAGLTALTEYYNSLFQ